MKLPRDAGFAAITSRADVGKTQSLRIQVHPQLAELSSITVSILINVGLHQAFKFVQVSSAT